MDGDALFREYKPELQELMDVLFGASERLLRKHGNFMPNGALLKSGAEVAQVIFDSCKEVATSAEVLPGLHEALREQAAVGSVRAIGLAEYVTVTREGEAPTGAIKVSLEHSRGFSIALYLPFRKRLFRGYEFGEIFWRSVDPEVGAFSNGGIASAQMQP